MRVVELQYMDKPTLTDSQSQVFELVAQGLGDTLTERLGLSEQQANDELAQVFKKYGLSSRVEIILFAHSQRNLASRENEVAA
jgi:DNA-binding NarL/FixJ family response regulator